MESEIARLEKERQSAENEHEFAHERLEKLIEAKARDKAGFEGIWRDIEKSAHRLRYVSRLIDSCQMMKDGTLPLPRPRTDRAWSDDPIFDLYLEDQHRKRKRMAEDVWEKYMEERTMEEDAWY